MGGSVGKSESDSESFNKSLTEALEASKYQQDIWEGQRAPLQDMYAQVGGLFDQYLPAIMEQVQFGQQGANQNYMDAQKPFKYQMDGGAFSGLGLQNLFRDMTGQQATDPRNQQLAGEPPMVRSRATGEMRPVMPQGGYGQERDTRTDDQKRWDEMIDWKRAMELQPMMQAQNNAQQWGIGQLPQMQQSAMAGGEAFNLPWNIASHYANVLGRPTVLDSASSNSSLRQESEGSGSSDSKGLGVGLGKG